MFVKSLYNQESVISKDEVPKQILSGPFDRAAVYQDLERTLELYSNIYDVTISEASRTVLSVDTTSSIELFTPVATLQDPLTLRNALYQDNHYFAKVRAMIRKFPGFIFSSYPQSAYLKPPVFISLKQYERMMRRNYNSSWVSQKNLPPPEAPMRALFIKCKDESSIEEREDVINSLRTWIMDNRILITNTKKLGRSLDKAVLILDIFQNTVATIIIVLCFFMLFVSFTSNITENAWEFGVLRALGLTSYQVIRVYIYEALALVFSSVIIGFFSGSLISTTLAMEANLFTEYPLRFEFPVGVFTTVVILSVIVAFLASYIPASVLLKKRIASALKGK